MTTWKQTTTVNGEAKYEERIIDSDKLLRMMAQCHLNKQAGEDFTLKTEVNSKYEVITYIFVRKLKDRIVINRFEKQEG